jgi:hypothetical protein
MHFLSPWYAALVVLGALPVIIHLMGRRRARVQPLPTLLLLYASHRRVAQRTQVRHIALLLLRMLVCIAAPLVLAKPFFETTSDLPARASAQQSAVLVLDDSLSMRYVAPTGAGPLSAASRRGESLFARAKKRATRLIEALPPSADVALVLGSRGNAAPQAELTHDRARLFSVLSGLSPSMKAGDLAGGVRRAAQILTTVRHSARHIYLITDGSVQALQGIRPLSDTELSVVDVSDGQPLANRGIVDIRSEPAPGGSGQGLRISIEVANYSDAPIKELTATLSIDGQAIASGLLDVPASGRVAKRFLHSFRKTERPLLPSPPSPAEPSDRRPPPEPSESVQGGLHHISVALEPDALAEDDVRHLRVEVQRHIRVLLLDGEPRALRRDDEVYYIEMALHPGDRLAGEEAPFVVTTVPIDEHLPALGDFDVVLLCNAKAQELSRRQLERALRSYVAEGGGLFIALGDNVDVDAYNAALADVLPQPLAVTKTTGQLERERSSEDEGKSREEAPLGNGEHLGRFDRRHTLLQPFLHGRADDSLLAARFNRYVLLRPTPKTTSGSGVVLSFESGAPALLERSLGRGRVMLFTSTLDRDWNDLPIQPAFLPLLQQIVRYLARAPLRESEQPTLVGQPREVRLQSGDARVEVTLPSSNKRLFERLGGRQILTFNDTHEAGFYRVAAASESGPWHPRPAEFFVVNVDPAESDLRHATVEQIKALERPPPAAKDSAETAGPPQRRVELWHYIALVILFFLLGEALLLRQK